MSVSHDGFSPDAIDTSPGHQVQLTFVPTRSDIVVRVHDPDGAPYPLLFNESTRDNPYPVSSSGTTYTVVAAAPDGAYEVLYDDSREGKHVGDDTVVVKGTINVKKPQP
jgi:hypothetical protein